MDLSAITIQQLRYVVAVDRHRSFREAARACHVSQPALSAQIKKVEELLSFHVFDRSRQPVTTTDRGLLAVAHARSVLAQIAHFAEIGGSSEEVAGGYRLGVLPTLSSTILPRLLPRFVRAYPKVELEVFEEKTEVLVRRLRDGSLDGGIAITPLDVPGIHERVVCHEAFLAYLPPRHALAKKDRLRQAALVDEHVWLLSEGHCFRTQALHLCAVDRRHVEPNKPSVVFDGGSFDTLMNLVDAGFGITVVPELLALGLPAARRAAQVRRFGDPEPRREISLLAGREHLRRGIADALFATLKAGVPPELQPGAARANVIAPTPRRSKPRA
ncbi:MAG: LysR family transcriptional regulator [Labilithrix sp.]|nr:LysR family transcriptional regulator [Labilithrix sp.]MBX3221565.1 LysR family transcriptional regulator [Labilithrix sp.]